MFKELKKLLGGEEAPKIEAPPEKKMATVVELEEPTDEFDENHVNPD